MSLASFVRAYADEDGRRYHAYRAGTYLLSSDDTQQDRGLCKLLFR